MRSAFWADGGRGGAFRNGKPSAQPVNGTPNEDGGQFSWTGLQVFRTHPDPLFRVGYELPAGGLGGLPPDFTKQQDVFLL